MSTTEFTNQDCQVDIGAIDWEPNEYRCHLAILREGDGTFSAIVLNLPGAGSCGDTQEDAIANAREAVAAIIECHLADREQIPWKDWRSYTVPAGAIQKWILVHV